MAEPCRDADIRTWSCPTYGRLRGREGERENGRAGDRETGRKRGRRTRADVAGEEPLVEQALVRGREVVLQL